MRGADGRPRRTFAFVNAVKPGEWGGIENWMVVCARALRDRGHGAVVLGREGSEIVLRAGAAGVPVREVDIRSDFDPATILRVRNILRRDRADLLCVNMNKDLRIGGIAAKSLGLPVVCRKGMVWMKDNALFRVTYRRLVDGIIVPSRYLGERLREYPWLDTEIAVIPVGVAPGRFDADPGACRSAVIAAHGLPADAFLVGTASRLVRHKGHQFLLPAMASLFPRFPEMRLVMAGTGPDEAWVRGIVGELGISDRVVFAGYMRERADIDRHLAACDVFALPSLDEPFGQLLVEAMALRRPIVATTAGGIPEVVDGSTAVLVPPGDSAALAAAVEALRGDPAGRRAMGEAGRRRVEEAFTLDAMIDRVERFFLGFTERRGAAGPPGM